MAKGINKKSKKKSKKVNPLLEVLKATSYAGAIFTTIVKIKYLNKREEDNDKKAIPHKFLQDKI